MIELKETKSFSKLESFSDLKIANDILQYVKSNSIPTIYYNKNNEYTLMPINNSTLFSFELNYRYIRNKEFKHCLSKSTEWTDDEKIIIEGFILTLFNKKSIISYKEYYNKLMNDQFSNFFELDRFLNNTNSYFNFMNTGSFEKHIVNWDLTYLEEDILTKSIIENIDFIFSKPDNKTIFEYSNNKWMLEFLIRSLSDINKSKVFSCILKRSDHLVGNLNKENINSYNSRIFKESIYELSNLASYVVLDPYFKNKDHISDHRKYIDRILYLYTLKSERELSKSANISLENFIEKYLENSGYSIVRTIELPYYVNDISGGNIIMQVVDTIVDKGISSLLDDIFNSSDIIYFSKSDYDYVISIISSTINLINYNLCFNIKNNDLIDKLTHRINIISDDTLDNISFKQLYFLKDW